MAIRLGCLWLLLCTVLPAQVVRLANHGATPFAGWKRTTVAKKPPHKAGTIGEARYVLGREVGRGVWAVDLHVSLAPGERRNVDMGAATATEWTLAPPHGVEWTGGGLDLDGQPMQWVSLRPDGAAWTAHLRLRHGRMLCTDAWLRHYPGEGWAHGEALTTASNPTVPDITEDAGPVRLTFGAGVVVPLGRQPWQPLISATRWSDGQSRMVPFVVLWPRHVADASWQSLTTLAIGAVGIRRVLPHGNPAYPAGHSGLAWARQHLPAAVARLHDWGPTYAIASNSGQSGGQEEQLFARGEPLLADGVGAEWVVYLGAAKWANRPSHFLESDGSPINITAHPDLVLWGARPHSSGSDRIGKPPVQASNPPHWEVPGEWAGPDRQHWLANTLAAGCRYTGSPALQRLLRNQAAIFLLGETVDPDKPTSHAGAARAVGYAGILAVQLWENLEDRALARAVRQRWIDRVEKVYMPQLGTMPGAIWDPRADERLTADLTGYTTAQQNYQQAMGAYGLDLACEILGPADGREMARAAAQAVVDHAWRQRPNGDWIHWDHTGYAGGAVLPESELQQGRGAHRTGWFEGTWCVPGIAVLLRHDPTHAIAREIWEQHATGGGSWVPPGVPQ